MRIGGRKTGTRQEGKEWREGDRKGRNGGREMGRGGMEGGRQEGEEWREGGKRNNVRKEGSEESQGEQVKEGSGVFPDHSYSYQLIPRRSPSHPPPL